VERRPRPSAEGRSPKLSTEERLSDRGERSPHPAAEAWLAALVDGRKPSDSVREAPALYSARAF
ncbi:MAG: hypothetical protein JXB36_08135, partial [Gammaproteobacteria bacterium]|nr:hypothetical protein [Gammaproteobacteria bacterium]